MGKYLRPRRGYENEAKEANIKLLNGEIFMEYPDGVGIGKSAGRLIVGNGNDNYSEKVNNSTEAYDFKPFITDPSLYQPLFEDSAPSAFWEYDDEDRGATIIDKIKMSISTLPEIIGNIKATLCEHTDNLRYDNKRIMENASSINTLDNKIDSYQQSSSQELSKKVDNTVFNSTVSSLTTQINTRATKTELNSMTNSLTTQINARATKTELNSVSNSLNNKINSMDDEFSYAISVGFEYADYQIKQLRSDVESIGTALTGVVDKLNATTADVASVKSDISNIRLEINNLKSRVTVLEGKIK